MSDIWISLKNSLNCKSHSTDVHDPIKLQRSGKINTSNVKNKHQSSPISQSSSAILNPVTHEIVLDSESGEVKICLCCPYPKINVDDHKSVVGGNRHHHRSTRRTKKTHVVDCDRCNLFSKPKVLSVHKGSSNDPPTSHGECCDKKDSIEEQAMLENSVIQLHQQDSSWQIIERICQTNSNIDSERLAPHIECVLKVQNTPKTFASFEQCREIVMINAERQQQEQEQNKHPRCLADGNELMRFHGTTISCSLGVNGSSNNLCNLDQCGLCQILRNGFSANKEFHVALGVLTHSTSEQAFGSTTYSTGSSNDEHLMRKCVLVCRVIAGRVHNDPLHENQEIITDSSCFDSLVKKQCKESSSDIEELFVLNPRAILPCFVVIYKL